MRLFPLSIKVKLGVASALHLFPLRQLAWLSGRPNRNIGDVDEAGADTVRDLASTGSTAVTLMLDTWCTVVALGIWLESTERRSG